jgi:hypothetical protein
MAGNHDAAGLDGLSAGINRKCQELFEEADLPVDFDTWNDRFALTGIEPGNWVLSFQDRKENLAHDHLHYENGEPADFAIDT